MTHAQSLPLFPEECSEDVLSGSWPIPRTLRDPTLVVRAIPGQFVTGCPSCHSRLVIDIIRTAGNSEAPAGPSAHSSVGSVLRHVTHVVAGTPLEAAAELLQSSARRLLAVVDSNLRPLGVLTANDVLAAAQGHTREEFAALTADRAASPARSLLTATERLDAVQRAFVRDDTDFALVVDDTGKLVGVLLATDILAACA